MPSRNALLPLILGGLAAAQEMTMDMGTSSSTTIPTTSASSTGAAAVSSSSSSPGSSSSVSSASGMMTMMMPTTATTMPMMPPPGGAVPLGTAPVSWSYFNTTVATVQVLAAVSTVCAAPTTYTFNDCEYPVTAGQTLIVTDCPCTVTTTMPVMTSTPCPVAATSAAVAVPPANANANAPAAAAGETPSSSFSSPPPDAVVTSAYGAPTAPTATPSAAVQMAGAPAAAAVLVGDGSLWGLAAGVGAAVLMRAI